MEKFIFWRPEFDKVGDAMHHATIQVVCRGDNRDLLTYSRMAVEIESLSGAITRGQMVVATVRTPRNHGSPTLVAHTRLRHGRYPAWEQHVGLPTYQW